MDSKWTEYTNWIAENRIAESLNSGTVIIVNHIPYILVGHRISLKLLEQKYSKMCPVCNHPKLFNLSDHLTKVHGISGQERKYWLSKAPYSTIPSHSVQAHSSVAQ